MDLVGLVILIFILIFINAFFVASEYALVSIRKTRVEELSKKGVTSAQFIKKVLNHIDYYISTIQLGITFASILLGWLGEPAFARLFDFFFSFLQIPTSTFVSHVAGATVAFIIITFLDIVFGEVVPKNIALQRPEHVASIVITPLIMFGNVFKPFINVITLTSMKVVHTLGFSRHTRKPVVHSEDEIKIILSQSAKSGEIEREEAEMVYKVFRIGDLPAVKSMIAKREVVAFDVAQSLESVIDALKQNTHSRFPVYNKSLDHVVGFIHVKDIYKAFFSGQGTQSLQQTGIIREIIITKQSKRVDDLIIQMRRKRTHLAMVENKNGKTLGIVTLEDLLENIVGEIHDEFEKPRSR